MTRRGAVVRWTGLALVVASVGWLVWFFPQPMAGWSSPVFVVGMFAFFFGREF